MAFHISRWRYWWAYLVVILLVLYAIWLTDRAADVASWIVGSVAFVLFVIMEVMIRRRRVIINDAVEIISGNVRTRVDFKKIAGVSVQQSVLQNLLRYGTVIIKLPGEEIVLAGFAEPNRIKRQVDSHLHVVHEKHPHYSQKPRVGP
ncbi:MAG: PH domain-containing protein [Candidatus Woesearchaeota archaeon]